MKFHPPSFVLGFGTAVAIGATRKRLRPAIVEIAALGVHLGRLGRAVVERQREHAEDLWAEVEERVRHKARGARRVAGTNGARYEPAITPSASDASSTPH
jgi:hypothetical protein